MPCEIGPFAFGYVGCGCKIAADALWHRPGLGPKIDITRAAAVADRTEFRTEAA